MEAIVKNSYVNDSNGTLEAQQPLQKLTEPDAILKKTKLTPEDVLHLKGDERKALEDRVGQWLNQLEGEELEDFLVKIEEIVPSEGFKDLKNQIYEKNHVEICRVISNFIKSHNQIPTKNIIAKETGLSRQTVHKHLLNFSESEIYKEEMLKLRILNNKLLTNVYESAYNGNVKAARLFFEMTGELGNRSTNNFFIQINNLKVDESLIKQLPHTAVLEIESIITKSLPC